MATATVAGWIVAGIVALGLLAIIVYTSFHKEANRILVGFEPVRAAKRAGYDAAYFFRKTPLGKYFVKQGKMGGRWAFDTWATNTSELLRKKSLKTLGVGESSKKRFANASQNPGVSSSNDGDLAKRRQTFGTSLSRRGGIAPEGQESQFSFSKVFQRASNYMLSQEGSVKIKKSAPIANTPRAPQPISLRTLDTISNLAPQPISAKAPEPIAAPAPVSMAATTPEPISVKAPEPISAKAPEPVAAPAPASMAAPAPEPISIKAPEPTSTKASELVEATTSMSTSPTCRPCPGYPVGALSTSRGPNETHFTQGSNDVEASELSQACAQVIFSDQASTPETPPVISAKAPEPPTMITAKAPEPPPMITAQAPEPPPMITALAPEPPPPISTTAPPPISVQAPSPPPTL